MQKVLILCLVLVTLAWAQPSRNKIWWTTGKSVPLKSNTFNDYIGKDKHVVVQFYGTHASYAGESQRLVPEWDKLAEMYMGGQPPRTDVTVAKIDGWTFPAVSQKYGLKAFPVILFFAKGSTEPKERYLDPERTAEKISQWVERLANAAEKEPEKPAATPESDTASAEATANAAEASKTEAPAADTPKTEAPAADTNNAATNSNPEATQESGQGAVSEEPKVEVVVADEASKPTEQNQEQAKDNSAKTEEKAPEAQPTKAQPVAQPAAPKEVKVVLDTNLLKGQFTAVQGQIDTLSQKLQGNIADNFKKVDDLKELLNTHKQELTNLNNNIKIHTTKLDEVKQGVSTNKQEIHSSVTGHTDRQFEELKTALNQVKAKLNEKREEPSGSNFGQGAIFFVIGSVVGAGVAYVFLNSSGKNRRKLLID